MKKVAETLLSHRELILNYFRAKKQFCSGVIEGLNNKAKLTMKKAYGFRTFPVIELALYHTLGKLPEPDVAQDVEGNLSSALRVFVLEHFRAARQKETKA